jgi:hypothetical protein
MSAADLDTFIKSALSKLLRIFPTYSIEAWCYQNTAIAVSQCAKGCRRHLETIAAWSADRTLLDDVDKPKDRHPCLGSKYNLDMAKAPYPADETLAAGRSFAEVALSMTGCASLIEALALTYAQPGP